MKLVMWTPLEFTQRFLIRIELWEDDLGNSKIQIVEVPLVLEKR